jgi:hypothetical protein
VSDESQFVPATEIVGGPATVTLHIQSSSSVRMHCVTGSCAASKMWRRAVDVMISARCDERPESVGGMGHVW